MEIKSITIEGFRGFSKKRKISFSKPNGNIGSGLTVFVGPNNSGKSTIIEAVFTFARLLKDIPKSARNEKVNGKIDIKLEIDDDIYEMLSYDVGGSSVYYKKNDELIDHEPDLEKIFILSSHRYIGNNLNGIVAARRYGYFNGTNYRDNINSGNFGNRLKKALLSKEDFDNCFKKIQVNFPKWYLETDNTGNQYLEFDNNGIKYISSGSGDGMVNLFNIIDSIYDSDKNEPIFIDEPEKSIHPAIQKKLFELLIEYSKDRQIIIATHSPYFIDWNNILNNGMKVIRVVNTENDINIYEISDETKSQFKKIAADSSNPHIFGKTAAESFFLEDNIIVVEGQDDVFGFKKIFEKYNYIPNANFYGWGAGGFEKIETIINFLQEIGYKKVMIIADNNKKNECKKLEKNNKYINYKFITLPCDDIRKKKNKKLDKSIKKISKIKSISIEDKEQIINILKNNFYNNSYLIEEIGNLKISKEHEWFIDDLIKSMDLYFGSIKNEVTIVSKSEEKLKIHTNIEEIIYKNLEKNPISTEINKLNLNEEGGGYGGIKEYQQISDNNYSVLVELEEGRGDKVISATLKYLVNLNEKTCVLENYFINKNTFENINFYRT